MSNIEKEATITAKKQTTMSLIGKGLTEYMWKKVVISEGCNFNCFHSDERTCIQHRLLEVLNEDMYRAQWSMHVVVVWWCRDAFVAMKKTC